METYTVTQIADAAISGILPPQQVLKHSAYWFIFSGSKLLVRSDDCSIPQGETLNELGLTALRQHYFSRLNDQACYAVEVAQDERTVADFSFKGLRSLTWTMPFEWFMLAGTAWQILNWDKNHQFCGRCGTPMLQSEQERAKRCPHCQLVNYPRISPAVIVLIYRGQEILLSRAPHFFPEMYSLQAGFVEVGESLEQTIEREIKEEVGLTVKNINYFGSQPWPFPDSLMIGFTAEYAAGDLQIDHRELEDAQWFHRHHLPKLPSAVSIARRMINWFIEQP